MAEFYSARGWEIPPLPWTNLSPPFSGIRRQGVREAAGRAIIGSIGADNGRFQADIPLGRLDLKRLFGLSGC